jgi:hypothetical protein
MNQKINATEIISKLNNFIEEKAHEIGKENKILEGKLKNKEEFTNKEEKRVNYLLGYSDALKAITNLILKELKL